MKKRILAFLKYVLLLLLSFFLLKIFVPKNYSVPQLQKRAGTKFMDLQTGSRIGYTILTGKGNKKPFPVIYLHGGPGGKVTDATIELLSNLTDDGYDVFLYDQIGSGQSGKLKNIAGYTVARHLDDLQEIIKKTGKGKVILIGQSWGAVLAVLFTAQNPNEIEKIIFTSPGPIYPYRKELESVKAPDSFHLKSPVFTNAGGNNKAGNLRTRAMAFFAARFGIKLAPDKEADDFETYLNYEVDKSTLFDTSKILKMSSGGGFYARVITFESLLKVQDPRPKLNHLNIPVLVLKGQYDNQKWGFTNEYLELFKNHQLEIIPNAGHYISVEQPALYIKSLRNFLTD
ncbi:MAG: alpha/beta hydrolase [Ferruginibacter sp.]